MLHPNMTLRKTRVETKIMFRRMLTPASLFSWDNHSVSAM